MPTSNIFDPISKDLDHRVFNGTSPKLSIVKFIERVFDRAFKHEFGVSYHLYTELYLTGSLTTYQYGDTSDCDISVFPNYHQLEQLTGQDDSIIRKRLIAMNIEHLDGTFLPGGSHPMQFFALPDGVEPQDRFHPGIRSGWSFSTEKWIVPPEPDRVHDIEIEFPEMYSRAAAIADKMTEMLDVQNYDAAKQLWQQVHRKRQLDQQSDTGGGDFTEGNIVYKYLVHEGIADRLRNEAGIQITTKEAAEWDNSDIDPRILDSLGDSSMKMWQMLEQQVVQLAQQTNAVIQWLPRNEIGESRFDGKWEATDGDWDNIQYSFTVYCPHITGELSYFAALHEIGHCVFRQTYAKEPWKHFTSQEEELWAWHWALEHSQISFSDRTLEQAQKFFQTYENQPMTSPHNPNWVTSAWDGDPQRLIDILLQVIRAYSADPTHTDEVMENFLVGSLSIPKADALNYMAQAWSVFNRSQQQGDEHAQQMMEQHQEALQKAEEQERQLAQQHGEQVKKILDRFDNIWPDSVDKDLDGSLGYQVEHVLDNGNEWKFAYRRGVGAFAWGDGEIMSLNDGIHPHTYVLYDDLDVNKIIPGIAIGWIEKPPLREGDQPYQVRYRTFSGDNSVTPKEIQTALGLRDGEATIEFEGDYAKIAATPTIFYRGEYAYIDGRLYYGGMTHPQMIYAWEKNEKGDRGGDEFEPYQIPPGFYGNLGQDTEGNWYYDNYTAEASSRNRPGLASKAHAKLQEVFPGIQFDDSLGGIPFAWDDDPRLEGLKIAQTDPITIKVFYNFTDDRIILGTQADSYRYPNTVIVGDYDPASRSVTLHRTENQWLNANYFRRLWAFSFPKRPLDNVYFQHGLTEDQKMHLPTREPQHVQHA